MLIAYHIHDIVLLVDTSRATPNSSVDISQAENIDELSIVIRFRTHQQQFTISQLLVTHEFHYILADIR
jgi:hypothetical protein